MDIEDDIISVEEDLDSSVETEAQDPFDLQGPVYQDGLVYLSRVDMLILNESLNKLDIIGKEKEIYILRMEKLRREHAEVMRAMEGRKSQCGDIMKSRQENHKKLLKAFKNKYGIDMTKVSYDDETGVIRTLDNHDMSEAQFEDVQKSFLEE